MNINSVFDLQQHYVLPYEQCLHKLKLISEYYAEHLKQLKPWSKSVSAGTHFGHT